MDRGINPYTPNAGTGLPPRRGVQRKLAFKVTAWLTEQMTPSLDGREDPLSSAAVALAAVTAGVPLSLPNVGHSQPQQPL